MLNNKESLEQYLEKKHPEDYPKFKSVMDNFNEAAKEKTKILDEIMYKETKFKIGDEIWDVKKQKLLGVVSSVYRIHQGDERFDNGWPTPHYQFHTGNNCYDNTSRQYISFGTRKEAAEYNPRFYDSVMNRPTLEESQARMERLEKIMAERLENNKEV